MGGGQNEWKDLNWRYLVGNMERERERGERGGRERGRDRDCSSFLFMFKSFEQIGIQYIIHLCNLFIQPLLISANVSGQLIIHN